MRLSPGLLWTLLGFFLSVILLVLGWNMEARQLPWTALLARLIVAIAGVLALYQALRSIIYGGGILTSSVRKALVDLDHEALHALDAVGIGASEGLLVWIKCLKAPAKQITVRLCLARQAGNHTQVQAASPEKYLLVDLAPPGSPKSFRLGGTGSAEWTPPALGSSVMLVPKYGPGDYYLRLEVNCDMPGPVTLKVWSARTRFFRRPA